MADFAEFAEFSGGNKFVCVLIGKFLKSPWKFYKLK
jgi:hypothetical protein